MSTIQDTEVWLPIPDYEGHYEASSHGQIRSLKRYEPHVLTPQWNEKVGKYHVSLCLDGRPKTCYVHTLVASTFHGLRPKGMWACHNNDDSHDNRAENLRWDTPDANHRDMIEAGNHHYGKRPKCKYGHEFTPENTQWATLSGGRYVNPSRYRLCLTCRRINNSKKKKKLS